MASSGLDESELLSSFIWAAGETGPMAGAGQSRGSYHNGSLPQPGGPYHNNPHRRVPITTSDSTQIAYIRGSCGTEASAHALTNRTGILKNLWL